VAFEELNRCPSYMRAPCLQLLTTRTLNDYILPAGWLPVAAINPGDAGYEVDELDAALLSRFVQVVVEPDREEWLIWARDGGGIHAGVIAYVASDPAIFDGPEGSPRSWASVSGLLLAAAEMKPARETLLEAVGGVVGPARAVAFLRYLDNGEQPLTAGEVLAYPLHREQLRVWTASGRLDLVQASLLAIKKRLQAKRNYDEVRANRTSWKNLGLFLGDLPGDLREDALKFLDEHGYDQPHARKGAQP
jgi:hypothetical protein